MNINQTPNNVNFTSIIPLKVFKDGAEQACSDLDIVENATSKVVKLLTKPANGDVKIIALKKEFAKYDKDFTAKSTVAMRKVVHNGSVYLFTNKQAEILSELGKKIGLAASQVKGIAERNYFDKISELLTLPNFRIKEEINPTTRAYEGAPLELHIHARGKNNDFEKASFNQIV